MAHKGGLGRGLGALIPGEEPAANMTGTQEVPIIKIDPNPRQPRHHIKAEELVDLAESIRIYGIIQPLIVTYNSSADRYVLVAGERRMRAAALAGLDLVPVLVRQVTEQQRLELALIENVQRADLTPLETAEAFLQLNEEFGLSHEEIASRVSKSRVAVTNTIRLLKLSESVRAALAEGRITEGHARALLGVNTQQAQVSALQAILQKDLTVRQTEELVRRYNGEKIITPPKLEPPPEIQSLEERLRRSLGTKVSLQHGKKGGSLVIYYYSNEELDTLVDRILRSSG